MVPSLWVYFTLLAEIAMLAIEAVGDYAGCWIQVLYYLVGVAGLACCEYYYLEMLVQVY